MAVAGRGLAGRALRLQGAPVDIALIAAGQRGDGAELAWGHVPAHPQWQDGQELGQACLVGADLAGWQVCAASSAQFRSGWQPRLVEVLAPSGWAWGQVASVRGADLLLPGEGSQRAEFEIAGEIRATDLVTRLADGRQSGELRLSPNWLGAQPGVKLFRARIAGHAGGEAVTGAWSGWQQAEVAAPQLQAVGPGWRRGDFAPVDVKGAPEPGAWSLHWLGTWLAPGDQAGPSASIASFATPGGPGGRSITSSQWWAVHGPMRSQAHYFQGQVQMQVWRGAEVWWGPAVAVKAPVLPAGQRIELVAAAGWRAALARFGLATHAAAVEAQLVADLKEHFHGLGAQIQLVPWPVQDGRETLRLWLGDGDSNGLHLIGADSSLAGTGKDVGNQILDEQLGGFDAQAWAAQGVPVGGVFVGELLAFSAKLHPKSSYGNAGFDATFGPWCPQLGGSPAPANAVAAVKPAVVQLAAAVAEACAHEIGHALGLPADTPEFHPVADSPGRIMDSGSARPWAERAGLPGAAPAQWGAADAAYLARILPFSRTAAATR